MTEADRPKPGRKLQFGQLLRRQETGSFIGLVVVYAFFAVLGGATFLGAPGWSSFRNMAAEVGIVALPVGLLMIAGQFDVSVGALVPAAAPTVRAAGAGARMDREGIVHDGCYLARDGEMFRVDFFEACGKKVMVYGQTEVTRDLYDAQDAIGATVIHDAEDVVLHDVDSDVPWVSYVLDGVSQRLDCDYIAGCDGFHGVSRPSIPGVFGESMKRSIPLVGLEFCRARLRFRTS